MTLGRDEEKVNAAQPKDKTSLYLYLYLQKFIEQMKILAQKKYFHATKEL